MNEFNRECGKAFVQLLVMILGGVVAQYGFGISGRMYLVGMGVALYLMACALLAGWGLWAIWCWVSYEWKNRRAKS